MSFLDTLLNVGGQLLGGSGGGGGGAAGGGGGVTNNFNMGAINPLLQGAGKYFTSQNLQQLSDNQMAAYRGAMGAYGLSPTTFAGPGGSTVGFGGGAGPSGSSPPGGSGAGPFVSLGNGLDSAYGNYASAAGAPLQGTQDMLARLFGSNGAAAGGASSLMGTGFGQLNNPLIGQAFGAAGANIGNAGNDFTSTYNNVLQRQLQSLQRPTELAKASLDDSLFQRGQMGSSAGGLQTEAFARGLGEAQNQAATNAYSTALGARNSDIGAANTFAGIGSNGMQLGNSLLSNAFGQFNNTNAIGGNLANSIFNQNLGINNSGLNGVTSLNSLGLNNFKSALDYATANNNSMRGAAGTAGAMALNPNYAPGNQYLGGFGSLLGGLSNGQGGGVLGSLGQLFGNNNPFSGFGGGIPAGDLSGSLGQGFSPLGTSSGGYLGSGFDGSGLNMGASDFSAAGGGAAGGGAGALAGAGMFDAGPIGLGTSASSYLGGMGAPSIGGLEGGGSAAGGASGGAGLGAGLGMLAAAAAPFVIGPMFAGADPAIGNPLTGKYVGANSPGYGALSQYMAPGTAAMTASMNTDPMQAMALYQQYQQAGAGGPAAPSNPFNLPPQMSLQQLAQLLGG
jgi:hypothetical protein